MDPTTILTAARSALEDAALATSSLVQSLPDSATAIPDSSWTVREAAVHLVNDARMYRELATGTSSPIPTLVKEQHEVFLAQLIADIPETDPQKLAALMTASVEDLLAVTAGRPGDQEVVFHAGLPFDLARLLCVALGEELLHGYDMARAVGQPWPIDPAQAMLVLYGYGPTYPLCVNPQTTAGLNAAYGIELRGAEGFTVRFVNGEYRAEPPDSGPVDCTISADPVAFLLVGAGRLSQWAAIALGLLSAGGARPELALGFNGLFVFP